MSALFISFVASLLISLAGRDAWRVARIAAALGPGAGLLLAIWLSATATSALAAWLGALLAGMLDARSAQLFVALALALAGIELLVLRPPRPPREPTRSAGAMLLVLLAAQATDGARCLVLALVVATAQPLLAGAGGALGSGAALTLAALSGSAWEGRLELRWITRGIAAALIASAAVIVILAPGIAH